jgi:hypothetical protein
METKRKYCEIVFKNIKYEEEAIKSKKFLNKEDYVPKIPKNKRH